MSESNSEPLSDRHTFRVVVTGGPCAGKTSALAMISSHFRGLGWTVYTVPEVASMFICGGAVPWEYQGERYFEFQKNVFKGILQIEDGFADMARHSNKNVLIVSDRGLMDGRAYCDEPGLWERVLEANGKSSETEIKDARYDCVLHMVSCAQGAEDFYTLDNNEARTEGLQHARALDRKTLDQWVGHPFVYVIDNSTGFKEKVVRAVATICRRFGVPAPKETILKRKYLVSAANLDDSKITYRECECEYFYVGSVDDSEWQHRIRSRTALSDHVTFYTYVVRSMKTGESKYFERRRNISSNEYKALSDNALTDHERVVLKKKSFVYKDMCYDLSTFEVPERLNGLMLLETYVDEAVKLELPDAVTIEREVTDDKNFSLFHLAKKQDDA